MDLFWINFFMGSIEFVTIVLPANAFCFSTKKLEMHVGLEPAYFLSSCLCVPLQLLPSHPSPQTSDFEIGVGVARVVSRTMGTSPFRSDHSEYSWAKLNGGLHLEFILLQVPESLPE